MTYEEAQHNLIDILRERGVHFSYTHRLPIFWLRNHVRDLPEVDDMWVANVTEVLDTMVEMRTKGLEPKHEDGQYV